METKKRGSYTFKVVRGDDTVELRTFKNIITDIGLTGEWSLLEGALPTCCRVGTGTTEPTVGDTDLEAVAGEYATTAASHDDYTYEYVTDGTSRYKRTTVIFTWARGDILGSIAEVGVYSSLDFSKLISRSLVRDGSNNITPISLGEEDLLEITYVLDEEIPYFDDTFTVDILGTSTSCRLVSVNLAESNYTNGYQFYLEDTFTLIHEDVGNITCGQVFNKADYSYSTAWDYDLTTDHGYTNIDYGVEISNSEGNDAAGIHAIAFDRASQGFTTLMIIFDTPIPKTLAHKITLAWNLEISAANG